MTPLLVFDINVVMDIWLGRDGEVAVLLLQLAEQGRIDLVIPEFVLMEFQGTARRWVTDQRALLADSVRRLAKEWGRSSKLGSSADDIRSAANQLKNAFDQLEGNINDVSGHISKIGKVEPHAVRRSSSADWRRDTERRRHSGMGSIEGIATPSLMGTRCRTYR